MGLRSRSVLGCAWLVFNLLAVSALAQASRNELEEKFRITNFDDDVEISMRRTLTGAAADTERAALATIAKASLTKNFLNTYQRRYGPRTRAVGEIEVNDDAAGNVITMALKMTAPTLVRELDTNWTVYYQATNLGGALPRHPANGQPLVLPAGRVYRYTMEIEFPAEVAVFGNTVIKKVADEAFAFSMDTSFRGNHARAATELRILQREVDASPARLAKYEVAAKQVYDFANASMFATKEGVRVRRLLAVKQPTMRQLVEHNSQAALQRTTKAIDDRPKDAALAQALCERAAALTALGRLPDALRDANQAVEASPSSPIAHYCRGTVLANSGDSAQAIAEFGKVIELDPLSGTAYMRRGIANYHAGQLAAAVDDFTKSQRASEAKSEVSIFNAMWRTVALKRMGREPDPALRQLAAEQPHGEWPRPALAMLYGLVDVDEMLAIAQRQPGIERDMAMTEAWFAAGQWYLMQGDKAKAVEAFRKVREDGVRSFLEYGSAAAELAGLDAAVK